MSIQKKKAVEAPKSNKKLLIICAVCSIVAVALVIVLIVLSNQPEKIIYNREDDSFISRESGIKYYPLEGVEPVSRQKKARAVIINGSVKTYLYEITGLDPETWLTDADGTVYRAGESSEFDFSNLKADRIDFCVENKTITSVAQLTDKSKVWAVLEEFANGQTVDSVPISTPDKTYVLRISLTDEYEGLFYTLKYVEYLSDVGEIENGKYLLKSMLNDKIVVVNSTSAVGLILHDTVK